MRRFITATFGLFAAAAGVLMLRRDDDNVLRPVQIVTNELSWFSALVGGVAVLWSILGKPRLWFGFLTGALGMIIALKPFGEYQATVEDAASAMRAGLGRDYETHIPSGVRGRLLQAPLTLANMFGEHLRAARARVWRNVVYAERQGAPLKLDVYESMSRPIKGESYPAILILHGGGWRNGDKQEYHEATNRYLANLGFVIFDIQYRLSTTAKWPAQLEDVQTAIEWVRNHADDYHVNRRQIALLGRSAGAHLAMITALRSSSTTQVQAVISFYGPADMKFPDLDPTSSIYQLMGGRYEDMPSAYKEASPVDWVRDNLPPLLIIEGKMDTIVPKYHGEVLTKRLAVTNSPYVHIRLPWARHGFDAVTFGIGAQLTQYYVDRFLAHTFFSEHA